MDILRDWVPRGTCDEEEEEGYSQRLKVHGDKTCGRYFRASVFPRDSKFIGIKPMTGILEPLFPEKVHENKIILEPLFLPRISKSTKEKTYNRK